VRREAAAWTPGSMLRQRVEQFTEHGHHAFRAPRRTRSALATGERARTDRRQRASLTPQETQVARLAAPVNNHLINLPLSVHHLKPFSTTSARRCSAARRHVTHGSFHTECRSLPSAVLGSHAGNPNRNRGRSFTDHFAPRFPGPSSAGRSVRSSPECGPRCLPALSEAARGGVRRTLSADSAAELEGVAQ